VAYEFADAFTSSRFGYYSGSGWPTICGDGLSDIWPCNAGTLASDLAAHGGKTSPLKITLTENGEGDFTASITAEADVANAWFMMVAVLDEYVSSYGGGQTHLQYHAKALMTPVGGEAFSILAGHTVDIQKTFTVAPEWDYEKMGVVCWVQRVGGTNPSPSPDIPGPHEVYQSAFLAAGGTGVGEEQLASALSLHAPTPNPFREAAILSFELRDPQSVRVTIHDVAGRTVREIAHGEFGAGEHAARWDGRDGHGSECAAGVYFARAVGSGGQTAVARIVRLR
jgi:hypothetical protein